MLCRCGRFFKDKAQACMEDALNESSPARAEALRSAEEYYRLALDKYDQAYQIRRGHYPGSTRQRFS